MPNRAHEIAGKKIGEEKNYSSLNDMLTSPNLPNDTFPTGCTLLLIKKLLKVTIPKVLLANEYLNKKAKRFAKVVEIGAPI